jgi:hypothetical protein
VNVGAGLTEPERAASQRELDILRERVDAMDTHGTRGVGAIQLQVAELVKDFGDLRADNRAWQAAHEKQHEQDKQDRVNGRRWLIGIGLAAVASMTAVIGLLLDIASHLHS